MKTLLKILLGVLIVFVFLFIKEFIFTKDKLKVMKNDIVYNYYDTEKLKEIIKAELGESYEGNINEDFDNFVISVVLKKLSEYESDKNQRYNSFLSKTEIANFDELRQEEADNTEGHSISNDIFYLKVSQFLNGETYKKIENILPEMKKHSKLIIDLRDSSGGNFEELNRVSSLFIEPNTHIYSLKMGKNTKEVLSKSKEVINFEKIVLLINNQTASVSELFALTLRENKDNVTLIGMDTYGKDISYSIRRFKDKSAMIFISSIMEGPNHQQFSSGVTPDIYEGFAPDIYDKLSIEETEIKKQEEKEIQLNRAIKFLQE